LLLTICPVSLCYSQTANQEKEAIAAVIRTAYIGGAYNDADTNAMKEGFHDRATSQGLRGNDLVAQSLEQWQIMLDRNKMLDLKSRLRTSVAIDVIGFEGRAAVARVDTSNNGVRDLTDFLSLYKFSDGWKITNRIFASHPVPAELHQRTSEEWERAVNEKLQPPDRVLDAIGLTPGMVVGEIGAGGGRYTVELAKRVGSAGRVYANDISDRSMAYLRARCKKAGLANVEPILSKPDDPMFPPRSLDLAFMVWVYHTIETAPIALLKNLRASLKPGATLVIMEPVDSEIQKERSLGEAARPSDRPATIIEKIKKEAGEAGFELLRVETFLPQDYICILRVAPTGRR
jgi:ubiquinone/menaquinone biosynthesis C-methylase UbiE